MSTIVFSFHMQTTELTDRRWRSTPTANRASNPSVTPQTARRKGGSLQLFGLRFMREIQRCALSSAPVLVGSQSPHFRAKHQRLKTSTGDAPDKESMKLSKNAWVGRPIDRLKSKPPAELRNPCGITLVRGREKKK